MDKKLKEEIAQAGVEFMLNTAKTLVCIGIEGLDLDNEEHLDAAKTMVVGLMQEDEKFKESFLKKGGELAQVVSKMALVKEFDWHSKERLEDKRQKLTSEFSNLIVPSIQWMMRWPDRAHRDKIRRAMRK